ncbi:MAG: mechanosensitive ion channel domain-containing protein [bacterium]
MNPLVLPTQSTQLSGFTNVTQATADYFGNIFKVLPGAIFIFLLGVLLIILSTNILNRALTVSKMPMALVKVVVRLVKFILWLFLFIAIFQTLGLSNISLAMSGAIAALALGFSQGTAATVSDTISGLNLARDRHFRIGDKVMVGDNKTIGVIVDMDIRKTRLKSADDQIHVLPNSLIDKAEFVLIERATKQPTSPRKITRRPVMRTQASGATIGQKKG